MPVSNDYSTQNDYTSAVGRGAQVTKKNENSVSIDDFLQLMVSQLQNQDFMNPVDDAQYLTQMAQFASMQQMQELAAYSKSSYAMGLAGKNVTVATIDSLGTLNSVTGNVQKVSLVNNEYKIYVEGKAYTLDEVMEINGAATNSDSDKTDTTNKSVTAIVDGTSVILGWPAATTHPDLTGKVKYTVYYSKDKNMDTVEDVEKNGIMVGAEDRLSLTNESIKGLDPQSTYYVNVVVTDEKGNKMVYKKAAFVTQNPTKT